MKKLLLIVSLALAAIIPTRAAYAANIIGVGDNPNACGSATICSTNGTTGYLNNGTGQAFDISTINQWFQIDTDGLNHLATQTMAEPDHGAGNFLVVNDTGHTITSFALTLYSIVTSTTASAVACGGGNYCVNFQEHGGAANFFTTFAINGPACVSACGTASANATTGFVTYNWSGGNGIAPGATFDLNFASWDHTIYAAAVPEPSTWALMLFGFGAIGVSIRARRRRAAVAFS